MRSLLRTLALTALLPLVAACDDGFASGAGTITVALTSPEAGEGAALVRLVGPGLRAVTPLEGEAHAAARGDTLDVFVLRSNAGPLRFALHLQDTTAVPRGEVLQVAGPDNRVRASLAGYGVEIGR